MFSNNPLLAQLKEKLHADTPRVTGTVKATDKGFGFLETEDGQSLFLPPPMMKRVMHNDRIEAIVHENDGKKSAEPETLVTPGLERFIARIRKRDNRFFVIPDHPSISVSIPVRFKRGLEESQFQEGDWVVANIVRHPLKPNDRSFFAQVNELIAANAQANVPWRVTLARHALEYASPEGPQEWPLHEEGLERTDLTALPFFTIDSRTTRDMDDALHIEPRQEGGWLLRVAIADPTAYVSEGDAVDSEARQRAFTVYLPGQNVTMLPEILADDLCSLHAEAERPALACDITIGADGELLGHTFYAATVKSHAQLAYEDVSDWIESKGEWAPDFEQGEIQLRALNELTEARTAWRMQHAVVFKDRPDYVFDLDNEGNVLNIRAEHRRIAQRMIEEAMILANVCCAETLSAEVGHGIFNAHQGIALEKVDQAITFLAEQDITATREQLTDIDAYRRLRQDIDARGDAWLETRLRRFQGYTAMSAAPAPHFGMGLARYATWTSPIRKYGDMVNHRLLKAVLLSKSTSDSTPAEAMTVHLSERRRLNRMAERDVKDWLYVRYLSAAIPAGEVFDAELVDIRRGGLRVRLDANGASVFVPASTLAADKTTLAIDDKAGLINIAGECRFRLGDRVRVVLTDAREETRSLIGRVDAPAA